jgi:uncharacterized protein YoxC
MICQKCSAAVPEDQAFCGKCGYKLAPDTPASLGERLSAIEAQFVADSRSKATNQNYLELETAERVMSRVKTWANLILYFAGIPAAVALLALAVIFGRGAFDLRDIATKTKDSVNSIVEQARSEATNAKTTATDALNTSKQVNKDIQETRQKIGELKTQVDSRSTEVAELSGHIKASQDQLASLTTTVNSQSQQVVRLSQQLKAVETQKTLPPFGKNIHFCSANTLQAGVRAGSIQRGKPRATYMSLLCCWRTRIPLNNLATQVLQKLCSLYGATITSCWIATCTWRLSRDPQRLGSAPLSIRVAVGYKEPGCMIHLASYISMRR